MSSKAELEKKSKNTGSLGIHLTELQSKGKLQQSFVCFLHSQRSCIQKPAGLTLHFNTLAHIYLISCKRPVILLNKICQWSYMKRHNKEQWTFQDNSVKLGRIKHFNTCQFICNFISNGHGTHGTWFLMYISILRLEIIH